MSFSGDDITSSSQPEWAETRAPLTSGPATLDLRETDPRLITRHGSSHAAPPVEQPPTPRRRKRVLRGLLAALAVLVALLIVAAVIAAVWLRHSILAALPQIDGTLHVTGLSAPVTISRNAQGVPSIYAASVDDLLFAQGFVTAQDRLWQMDTLRRHAAGELAEILGPGLVDHDRRQRYLQLRSAADRAVQTLPAPQLHELDAYARGVNQFIDTHRDRLPVEFRLLHYQPRPWSPRDSLLVSLVMWQDLSTSFPTKLDREALAPHLPQNLLADLYPVGSWRDRPPTQPPADLTAPRDIVEIPLDPSQSRLEAPQHAKPGDLLALTAALSQPHCIDCRAGSNNWAVAGSRSASGSPLVSNDMHLGLNAPDIWYEAVLHAPASTGAPAIDIAGFTLPGVPWVLVGRNAHVAWGFTSLGGDVQDLRIEHLRGSGSATEYEKPDGAWAPVEHQSERIVVRGGHDILLDVQSVPHTIGAATALNPIISPLSPSERRALSLAWTLYDPANVDASFFAADTAPDGASLVAALAAFGGPSLNLVYADDHGHIGYHAIGRIPIRGPAVQHPRITPQIEPQGPTPESDEENNEEDEAAGLSQNNPPSPPTTQPKSTRSHAAPPKHAPAPKDQTPPPPAPLDYTIGSPLSSVPVDALDASQEWSGYIPYNEMPSIVDPPSGVLATANARITPDDYPYALNLDWPDAYRVERIRRLLDGRTGLTPQAMLAIQSDQHSEFDLLLAQRIAYAIDHASALARSPDAARLHQAADLLRDWRGDMSAGSPAAAIVSAAHEQLWPALLIPQIQTHDHGSHQDAARLAQLYIWSERTTALEVLLEHQPARWLPPGVTNWNDLLTNTAELGLQNAHAPRDLSHWQYGAIHTVAIEHPLFAGRSWLEWLLGARTGSGAQPAGGDSSTVDAIGHTFGPSERFTADLSDPLLTSANITTGESGEPGSIWYLDQFQPWLHATTFMLPLHPSAAEHTLTLTP